MREWYSDDSAPGIVRNPFTNIIETGKIAHAHNIRHTSYVKVMIVIHWTVHTWLHLAQICSQISEAWRIPPWHHEKGKKWSPGLTWNKMQDWVIIVNFVSFARLVLVVWPTNVFLSSFLSSLLIPVLLLLIQLCLTNKHRFMNVINYAWRVAINITKISTLFKFMFITWSKPDVR